MNRRALLKYASLLGAGKMAAGAGMALGSQAKATHSARKPIVLYCDMAVDPAREQEMLDHYHNHFKPVAEKFPGYIDLKIVKLRAVMHGGPAPEKGINYRFQLTYVSEEARQKWIASAVHQKNWPLIENTMLNRDYLVLLTDVV